MPEPTPDQQMTFADLMKSKAKPKKTRGPDRFGRPTPAQLVPMRFTDDKPVDAPAPLSGDELPF